MKRQVKLKCSTISFYNHSLSVENYGHSGLSGKIENEIVLIDGEQLAQLLIDHNIGVTPVSNFEIKKIDSDCFTEQ